MLEKELAAFFVLFMSKDIMCIILHILLNVNHNNRTVLSVFSKQFFVISCLGFTERAVFVERETETQRAESSAGFSEFWTATSVLLSAPKSKALASLA